MYPSPTSSHQHILEEIQIRARACARVCAASLSITEKRSAAVDAAKFISAAKFRRKSTIGINIRLVSEKVCFYGFNK